MKKGFLSILLVAAAAPAAWAVQDVTAPGSILDLKVMETTESSVRLGWTAVGEDDMAGAPSPVYNIMISVSPITEHTWSTQLPTAWAPPSPKPLPGTWIEWERGGLAPGWMLYFSVKGADMNPFQLSTGFVSIPAEHDDVPPDPVTGLSAAPDGPSRLIVRWINSADDGVVGRATEHDLRTSAAPITPESWETADRLNAPAPSFPGIESSMLLAGLGDGQTFHFAMKSRDAMGNWTANFVTATGTTLPPDGLSHGAGDTPCSGGTAPSLLPLAGLVLLLARLGR